MRRTTLLAWLCLTYLVGLGAARSAVQLDTGWLLLALVTTLFGFKYKGAALFSSLVLVALLLGWTRGSSFAQKLKPYENLAGQRVVAVVRAESDAIYGDRAQLTFDAGNVELSEPYQTELVGRWSIKGFGEQAVYRGDEVKIEGKLYKTRGSKQAGISFADIKVVGRMNSPIETVRRRFVAGSLSALPEPEASFGLGLLIGQRNTLPKSTSEQLAAVGLTHIIAVSGYNLTILAEAARRLFGKRSKYQTTVLSALLIGSFLLFTGFSASVVRAAIVSGLSLLTWYYGRQVRPILLLSFVAALTAGWYPLYLWSDIGWYLSFLAFYGVLILAPLLTKRIFRKDKLKLVGDIALQCLAAQLLTTPLILFIFKEVSVVSLLANLLVGPLIPVAMLMTLFAGLGGMFIPAMAGWVAWPARLLLTYILDIVNLLSHIPSILVSRSLALAQMLFFYGIIIVICVVLWLKNREECDTLASIQEGE